MECWNVASPQQLIKLFHSKACLFDNCPKRSFGYFFVVGNNKTAIRIRDLSEHYVAALLAVPFIPSLLQSRNYFSPRDLRENTHTATSITSSFIEGGIGS